MFNVHPIISTTDISRNTLSVSDIKLKDIEYIMEYRDREYSNTILLSLRFIMLFVNN